MKVAISRNKELMKCMSNLLHESSVDITFKDDVIFIDKHHVLDFYVLLQTVHGISTCPMSFSICVDPLHLWSALSMCTEDTPINLITEKDDEFVRITNVNASAVFPVVDKHEIKVIFPHRWDIEVVLDNEITVTKTEIKMERLENDFRKIFEAEDIKQFPPFYTFKFGSDNFQIMKGDARHFMSFVEHCKITGAPATILMGKDIERILQIFNSSYNVQLKCYEMNTLYISQKLDNVKYDYFASGMIKL